MANAAVVPGSEAWTLVIEALKRIEKKVDDLCEEGLPVRVQTIESHERDQDQRIREQGQDINALRTTIVSASAELRGAAKLLKIVASVVGGLGAIAGMATLILRLAGVI